VLAQAQRRDKTEYGTYLKRHINNADRNDGL
jgi:hypothetical protein